MRPISPFYTPAEILGHEIIQEQASSLGRLGRSLEAALTALRAFDATHPRTNGSAESDASTAHEARRALVAAAGQALWMFVVQREACGLREIRGLMQDYGVPPEVQERMGAFPAHKAGSS